jgi:F-type H+-transporting ATPase subunit delta
VKNTLLAQRYAKAILLNVNKKDYNLLRDDVKSLRSSLTENKDFIVALNSFLYPLKERLKLAEQISTKLNQSEIWRNLCEILIKKHRFNIIIEILTELENMILEENNKVKINLTLAFKHDDEIIQKIIKQIEKILECQVEETLFIDPSLIGGFVAETETVRIDGSVHNNLAKLVYMSLKDKK